MNQTMQNLILMKLKKKYNRKNPHYNPNFRITETFLNRYIYITDKSSFITGWKMKTQVVGAINIVLWG
jgi:hypothetical protein